MGRVDRYESIKEYIVIYFRRELRIAGRTCGRERRDRDSESANRGSQLVSPLDLALGTVPIVTAVINLF